MTTSTSMMTMPPVPKLLEARSGEVGDETSPIRPLGKDPGTTCQHHHAGEGVGHVAPAHLQSVQQLAAVALAHQLQQGGRPRQMTMMVTISSLGPSLPSNSSTPMMG